MTPRRILVTGAGGFVGRHLMAALGQAWPDADLVAGAFDICDRAGVTAALRQARPDACVHLAAVTAVPTARRDPERAWQVNLHGTLNIAEAIREVAPAALLLFASSADAYGGSLRPGLPVNEQAPLAPMNPYSATKAAADLALGAMAAEGLRLIRVRPFNHTGPGQSEVFVLPGFAMQIARIEAGAQPPVLHVGDLEAARDFLDVRDICAAYVACLRRADSLEPGAILNIASGVPRRIGAVLEQLMRAAGTRAEVRAAADRVRPADIAVSCGDAAIARRTLEWYPRIPWERTIADLLDDARGRVAGGS